MLRLTGRADIAAAALGQDAVRRLVLPRVTTDGPLTVAPLVLVDKDRVRRVFLPELDSPVLAVARPVPITLHGFYFTWDSAGPRPTLAASIAEETAGVPLLLDAGTPVALLQAIERHRPLIVEDAPLPSIWASALPYATAEAAWAGGAEEMLQAARRVVHCLVDRRTPAVLTDLPDARFATLEHTMEEAGLESVLVTAPIPVQGLTGLTLAEIDALEAAVIFHRGDREVLVLSPSEDLIAGARRIGRYPDMAAAIAAHGQGRLGYEEANLPIAVARPLFERHSQAVAASAVVRRWEERMAGTNVAGFLLAAQSTVQSIECAIAGAQQLRRDESGCSEAALDDLYRSAVQRFSESVGLRDQIQPYFSIIHAGERTLYPAAPTSHPITAKTRTVKFDMGNRVHDRRGLVRGYSDLARTCTFTAAAADMAALLDEVVRDDLPRVVRTGADGGQVYERGLEILREKDRRIRALGYLGDATPVEGYHRDFGHALGHQMPCTVRFAAAEGQTLEAGMVVCTEIVWPRGNEAFAQEDAWVLTPDGLVNLTRCSRSVPQP